MKKNLWIKMLGLLAGSIVSGALALLLVFSLPLNTISKNVEKSLNIFEEEGASPLLVPWCESFLDNFTDSIMLHNACYNSSHGLVNNALLVYRSRDTSSDPCGALIGYASFAV